MWANTLDHKRILTTRQHKSATCEPKEAAAKQEFAAIPDSWGLSDNQRNFIESFSDLKPK